MIHENVDHEGVHSSHCCKEHGCKYGEDDCPVVMDQVAQIYSCEECDQESAKVNAAMKKAVELGVMMDTPENRTAVKAILMASYNSHDSDSPW